MDLPDICGDRIDLDWPPSHSLISLDTSLSPSFNPSGIGIGNTISLKIIENSVFFSFSVSTEIHISVRNLIYFALKF